MTEQFFAFMSYSHTDKSFVKRLHKRLENYKLPKVDGQKVRLFPIFRDTEELPLSADLGNNLLQALDNSKCLMVIVTAASLKSKWVTQELVHFSQAKPNSPIFLVFAQNCQIPSAHPLHNDALKITRIDAYSRDAKAAAGQIAPLLSGIEQAEISRYHGIRMIKQAALAGVLLPVFAALLVVFLSVTGTLSFMNGQIEFNEKIDALSPEEKKTFYNNVMSEAREKHKNEREPLSPQQFDEYLDYIEAKLTDLEDGIQQPGMQQRFLTPTLSSISLLVDEIKSDDLSLIQPDRYQQFEKLIEKHEALNAEVKELPASDAESFKNPFR